MIVLKALFIAVTILALLGFLIGYVADVVSGYFEK